jgi:hypothetical protein
MVVITGAQILNAASAAFGFGAAVIFFALKYGRRMGPAIHFLNDFRGDWLGVPDRPGFPGHPGMAERMLRNEEAQSVFAQRQAALMEAITEIQRELVTNGGSSLRDAIVRIETQLHVTSAVVGAPVPIGSVTPDPGLFAPEASAQKAA